MLVTLRKNKNHHAKAKIISKQFIHNCYKTELTCFLQGLREGVGTLLTPAFGLLRLMVLLTWVDQLTSLQDRFNTGAYQFFALKKTRLSFPIFRKKGKYHIPNRGGGMKDMKVFTPVLISKRILTMQLFATLSRVID